METALKIVISEIKSGLYTEEEGKIMFKILTNVGEAAEKLAGNLAESRQLIKVGSKNVGVAIDFLTDSLAVMTNV